MRFPAFFLACSVAASGETVTLTPSKDSDIYSYRDRPTTSTLTLGVNTSGPGSPHSQRTLIQFNLAGLAIPAAEIGSAKLQLFVIPPDASYGDLAPGTVSVFRQGAAWTISDPILGWNDFIPAEAIGSIAISANSNEKWVEMDATAMVIAWASGSKPNHGFGLEAPDENIPFNVSFASMEFPGYAPKLVITRKEIPPKLTISSGISGIVIQWPVQGSTGWVLQTSGSLSENTWTTLSGATQQSGNWKATVQPSPSGRGFFRLSKP